MIALRVLAVAGGSLVALVTIVSAIKSFVLPRAALVRITRSVFVILRAVADRVAPASGSYERRDRALALVPPFALLALPAVWLTIILGSFTAIFWGVGVDGFDQSLARSSSSLMTLGYSAPANTAEVLLGTAEAGIGLGLLALLISYLPTIYAAFSRREKNVSLLEAHADAPPSPLALIVRYHRIRGLDRLDELFRSWQDWFADIEESHTSIAALSFFRSPQPNQSWVTSAGTILDAASLAASTLDIPLSPEPQLCIRAGYVALRRIGDFFALPYSADPRPDAPISITREEYDTACEHMEAAGVPLRGDREQAWRDFAGWRVNYDEVLRRMAGLTAAPAAMWSSDRALPYRQPPVFSRRRTRPAG